MNVQDLFRRVVRKVK